ncbi:MAG: hypothetical protein L0216_02355 [Planctomycetales bacterium]|nr:hypothetical protein [Planctomycetales bacterium]
MEFLRQVARRLARAYGRRGWWPTTPPGRREPVYDPRNPYRRKSDREVVEVAVGAVLTQNTAWTNALRAFVGMRRARLFSLRALRSAPLGRIARAIRPSGYFRAKARKLRHLARFLAETPPRALRRIPTPGLRERLLAVHGIGPETADSILCFALDRPVVVADAYTRRIFARLGIVRAGTGYEETRGVAEAALPRAAAARNEFHARIVDLAKRHCRKREPLCGTCPLRELCPRVGVAPPRGGEPAAPPARIGPGGD